MKAVQLKPDIYWVGAVNEDIRDFHGYRTQRGTTYNSYLIIDEKVVLVDGVKKEFHEEMMTRIKSIIDPAKIDYIICNHVEMDHSGAIPLLADTVPAAEIICSPKGESGLAEHYFDKKLNTRVVQSGDELQIGKRTLSFTHIPMIHWPDSMVTYIPEEKLLLPNDAFGQHYTDGDKRFSDECDPEVLFHETAKYYANIVYPYGKQVEKALNVLGGLEIDMIAPSHGMIWRDQLERLLTVYRKWATNENAKNALIVYDTMWGSTEKLALKIEESFKKHNIPVIMRNLKNDHYSDVVTDLLDSKWICIGTPTLNNEMFPSIAAFSTYIKGLKPKNKTGFVFGSYGWASAAIKSLEEICAALKWETPEPSYNIKFIPKDEELTELTEVIGRLIK